MVSLSDITLNNESLLSPGSGPTAALVGCTNGIGLATLHALLKHTSAPTIYLVGRDSSRLTSLIASVQPLNSAATIVPILTEDLTLVASAQKAAEEIASRTSRLDLLILSPGYLTFNRNPDYSPEGLDRTISIRFHARMRIVVTLLPALRAAPAPRVVSVLSGGKEGPLNLDDLSVAPFASRVATSMTTLFFETLARRPGNEKIVFLHIYPGVVYGTGLTVQGAGVFVRFLWHWVIKPGLRLFGRSPAEAGERVLFAATNGRFRRVEDPKSAEGTLIQQGSDGVLGSGVYLVNADSSVVTGGGNAQLRKLRASDAGERVYEYTMREFERVGSM